MCIWFVTGFCMCEWTFVAVLGPSFRLAVIYHVCCDDADQLASIFSGFHQAICGEGQGFLRDLVPGRSFLCGWFEVQSALSTAHCRRCRYHYRFLISGSLRGRENCSTVRLSEMTDLPA